MCLTFGIASRKETISANLLLLFFLSYRFFSCRFLSCRFLSWFFSWHMPPSSWNVSFFKNKCINFFPIFYNLKKILKKEIQLIFTLKKQTFINSKNICQKKFAILFYLYFLLYNFLCPLKLWHQSLKLKDLYTISII